MKYTIGIGALINGKWANRIRELELQVGDMVNNYTGLGQPPHVTIKRSFDVDGIKGIRKCEEIMSALAKDCAGTFNITFDGIGHFGESVLFLQVVPNDTLLSMHKKLLTSLEPIFPGSTGKIEDGNMVFHSTLAMGLELGQFNKAQHLLNQYPREDLSFIIPIQKLGLFLGIDDNTHWVVISEVEVSSTAPR